MVYYRDNEWSGQGDVICLYSAGEPWKNNNKPKTLLCIELSPTSNIKNKETKHDCVTDINLPLHFNL